MKQQRDPSKDVMSIVRHYGLCRCHRRKFFVIFQLMMIVLMSESFSPILPIQKERRRKQRQNTKSVVGVYTTLFSKADSSSLSSVRSYSRRQWISKLTSSRTIASGFAILTGLGTTLPANSVADSVDYDSAAAAFEAVRRELIDANGGVYYLKSKVETGDFAALLEFTKTYDQVLRKGVMGKAKKALTDPDSKERATALANNVTFDLIGINRSSRKGQEDSSQATKYLDELQDDIRAFLDLEPKG
jgi:hypothetical protein